MNAPRHNEGARLTVHGVVLIITVLCILFAALRISGGIA